MVTISLEAAGLWHSGIPTSSTLATNLVGRNPGYMAYWGVYTVFSLASIVINMFLTYRFKTALGPFLWLPLHIHTGDRPQVAEVENQERFQSRLCEAMWTEAGAHRAPIW